MSIGVALSLYPLGTPLRSVTSTEQAAWRLKNHPPSPRLTPRFNPASIGIHSSPAVAAPL